MINSWNKNSPNTPLQVVIHKGLFRQGCDCFLWVTPWYQWYCWWFRNPADSPVDMVIIYIYHYLQGFKKNPRWLWLFGISSFNRTMIRPHPPFFSSSHILNFVFFLVPWMTLALASKNVTTCNSSRCKARSSSSGSCRIMKSWQSQSQPEQHVTPHHSCSSTTAPCLYIHIYNYIYIYWLI